jgi:hypothetical protein
MSDSPLLKILLAVVPVLSATLYLLGLTYNEGFLGAYGVEPLLFPLPSDITMLYGFFALGAIGLQPFYNIFLIVFSLLLIVILVAIFSSHSRVKALQVKIALRLQRYMPSKEVRGILDKGSTGYLYIIGVFLMLFLPFFIAVLSIKSGEKQAKLNMDKFDTKTGKWVMLHTAYSSTPIRAQQITCGNTHCAFWLGQEALILEHDKIEKIVAHNSSVK